MRVNQHQTKTNNETRRRPRTELLIGVASLRGLRENDRMIYKLANMASHLWRLSSSPSSSVLLLMRLFFVAASVLLVMAMTATSAFSSSSPASRKAHLLSPPKTTEVSATINSNDNDNNFVVWRDFSPETFLPSDKRVVKTASGQVACRVPIIMGQGDNKETISSSSKEQPHHFEFGTLLVENDGGDDDETASSPCYSCILHDAAARQKQQQQHHQLPFQIAVQNIGNDDDDEDENYNNDSSSSPSFYWAPLAFDVDPLGPNIVTVGQARDPNMAIMTETSSSSSTEETTTQQQQQQVLLSDIAICKYKPSDGTEVIGRMFLQGRLFGHCGYLVPNSENDNQRKEVFVGGNFHVLSAIPQRRQASSTASTTGNDIDIDSNISDNNGNQQTAKQQQSVQQQQQLEQQTKYNAVANEIRHRVELYLTAADYTLFRSITGFEVQELLQDLNNTSILTLSELSRILSMDRFLAHGALNTKGLAVLRAVLAERMIWARRRQLGLHHHEDTVEWEREGDLRKDFDHMMQHPDQLAALFQMVAATKDDYNVNDVKEEVDDANDNDAAAVSNNKEQQEYNWNTWVERNVTAMADDPQRQPHIDTFYSVVKLWVYERGVVTADMGPLHFMRGSHRSSTLSLSSSAEERLTWIYQASSPPATAAIQEPSLRWHAGAATATNAADDDDDADADADETNGATASTKLTADRLRPVLPLEEYRRTLIIADTSGIHHRGVAPAGTVRQTLRLASGNDGGLVRLNPFVWDGWDNLKGDGDHDEPKAPARVRMNDDASSSNNDNTKSKKECASAAAVIWNKEEEQGESSDSNVCS